VTREDVQKQLDRVTVDYQSRVGQRHEIRKLSVTVWLAVLVAVASQKLALSTGGNMVLLMAPVIMFWLLETLQASITTRRRRFICGLEWRLATNDYESPNPLDIYLNVWTMRSHFQTN
jgi:hypothetical protein